MTDDDRAAFRQLSFIPSRIPKLDAIATFVPAGGEKDGVLEEAFRRTGFSRWFPVDGGHRVQFPFEGGDYDASRFVVEPEGWDHETCKTCRERIPAMTLCFVTHSGPYVILCESCHEELARS